MPPIERLVRSIADFVMSACSSCLELFSELGPIQVGIICAIVLGIAAVCLRGTPVKGV